MSTDLLAISSLWQCASTGGMDLYSSLQVVYLDAGLDTRGRAMGDWDVCLARMRCFL